MDFEWDQAKDAANRRKHGVAFADAATIFADPLTYTFEDPDHARTEQRWLSLGQDIARAPAHRGPHRTQLPHSHHQRPRGDTT